MDAVYCKFERERIEKELDAKRRAEENLQCEIVYYRHQIEAMNKRLENLENELRVRRAQNNS